MIGFGRSKLALACAGVLLASALWCGRGNAQTGGASGSRVTFTDVTERAGIHFRHNNGAFGKLYMPESMGSGCAFVDYNGDGRPDIVLINGMDWPGHPTGRRNTLALYRNRGDGTFEDVTQKAGLAVPMYGMGVAAADYDNDGDEDLYVTCLGANHLFRNNGDGTFTDVTTQMGVADSSWSVCAVWVDYDRDGDLDLFVGNYLKWTMARDQWLSKEMGPRSYAPQLYDPVYPRLYRNDGKRFTDVSKESGIGAKPGKGMGAVAVDYNGDGWPDILMSNDTLPDFLYRNNGDGTFTEDGLLAGVAYSAEGVAKSGMGVDAGDTRNTGWPDLAVGSFSFQMVSLFQNEGKGYFTDQTVPSGVGQPSNPFVSFGVFFFDYDLDGHLDLFVSCGHVSPNVGRAPGSTQTYAQRSLLYHNLGNGRFEEVGKSAGDLKRPLVGRGAAWADYDGDGYPDVLVAVDDGRPALFHNNGGTLNRALQVRLVGTRSNRDGVGARVRVRTDSVWQMRTIEAGSSYGSESELVAAFGLGRKDAADEVEITWPDGTVERLPGVRAGQRITVREGKGIVARVPFRRTQ